MGEIKMYREVKEYELDEYNYTTNSMKVLEIEDMKI